MSAFAFLPENRKKIDALIQRYPKDRAASALMGALWVAQEQEGYVSDGAMREIAAILGLSEAEVFTLASFYRDYHLSPAGKHRVAFCRGICCGLKQGEKVREACLTYLNIGIGETTPDGLFTVTETDCLGDCVNAPAMRVDETYHDLLTPEKAVAILKKYEEEA